MSGDTDDTREGGVMRAYHFLKFDMTAGEGNEPPWTVGEEREVKGRLKMCARGYHSSPSWYNALAYAPGLMACVVEVPERGTLKDTDKQVSPKRKLIAVADATNAVILWACECAERALLRGRNEGREPDKRSWKAIEVMRQFVVGFSTTMKPKNAAEADAAAAYAAAARDAYAAEAAYAAADAAAAYAAAARDAEQEWQTTRLAEMLDSLFVEKGE